MTGQAETPSIDRYSIVQRRMAYAIQNVTADLTILTGEPAGEARVQRMVRDLSVANRVLREQAAAIGVPAEWIHRAERLGRLGRRTAGMSPLPAASAMSRPMLLAQLRHQVEALYTLPALAVVRGDRSSVDARTADRLGAHVRLQCLRVAMVATAINATEPETRGWWNTDPAAWAPRLAAVTEGFDLEGGRAWHAATQPAVLREARCRVAAMRLVGINPAKVPPHQRPPAPHLLEASAHHAWQTVRPVEMSAGELIEAAIQASGVEDSFGVERVDSIHDLSPPDRINGPPARARYVDPYSWSLL